MANALLIGLQIHFNFLVPAMLVLFDIANIDAGAVHRLLFVSTRHNDRQPRVLRSAVRLAIRVSGFVLGDCRDRKTQQ